MRRRKSLLSIWVMWTLEPGLHQSTSSSQVCKTLNQFFTDLQKSLQFLYWSTKLSSPNTVSSVKGGRRQVSCRRTGGQTRGIKGRLRLVEWRMFTVSVLGRDVGYTVKFNTLPEGVPKGKAQGNYWRQRVIFDRISLTEPVYRGCSTITSVTD